MRAAVEQVLALQIDIARQVAAARERSRPPGVIREQVIELCRERRIRLGIEERGLELLERGYEDFRNVAAAEPAEAAVQAHARSSCRPDGRKASNNAAIFSGDLRPGRSSSAEPTSMA